MSAALNATVPEGYKLTEVGVIPGDWEATAIASISSEIGDGIHATPIYSTTGNYYFINGNNLRDGQIFLTSETKTVDYSEYKKYRKNLGDSSILMSINGTIGNLGLFSGEAVVLGKSAAYLNVKNTVSTLFVYFSIQTELVKRQFFDGLTGSTIKNLGLKAIRATLVALPPTHAEQRAIATALSDVDALLAKLDQLIAKKQNLKQAAMQQLLTGQTRLPGFGGAWEVKRFSEIAAPRRDRIDPRKAGVQEFCVELEHIEQASGRLAGSGSTGEESSLKSIFQAEDVLFGKLRAYLRKYWLADRRGVCSTEIWALVANRSSVLPNFLFHLVTDDKFINTASTAYGTHMPRSDWNVVKNYEVNTPPLAEQTAIATVLSDLDAELAALQVRHDKIRALKQGMMQALLTGCIRLV